MPTTVEFTENCQNADPESPQERRLAPRRRAGPPATGGPAPVGRDERISRYERHLHNLLTSTLHEPERLQARRDGEAVPPPAAADIHVSVEAG